MKTITVGVYRRLDNRLEGLSDDSSRALELHDARRVALHDVMDHQEGMVVTSWGETDDRKSHEYVEIVIGIIGSKAIEDIVMPGLKWLGEQLAEKIADTVIESGIKWVVAKLWHKQETKQILDFSIALPDGTKIRVDPPDGASSILIEFSDGSVKSLTYSQQTKNGF